MLKLICKFDYKEKKQEESGDEVIENMWETMRFAEQAGKLFTTCALGVQRIKYINLTC